ncbi:unnamed protein product [Mytilus coruscus]|uniref:Uncharacterized protein n=1 Tax=Mytilus coruscus TaxID=42192 RepID=A0A6J8C4S5_MYTCO|nr:unnamed protein product [Mytilus coruscus]
MYKLFCSGIIGTPTLAFPPRVNNPNKPGAVIPCHYTIEIPATLAPNVMDIMCKHLGYDLVNDIVKFHEVFTPPSHYPDSPDWKCYDIWPPEDLHHLSDRMGSLLQRSATGCDSGSTNGSVKKSNAFTYLLEQVYYSRNLKLITPFAFQRNVVSYSLTNSKICTNITCNWESSGCYSTVHDYICADAEPITCPEGYVHCAIDNNQKFASKRNGLNNNDCCQCNYVYSLGNRSCPNCNRDPKYNPLGYDPYKRTPSQHLEHPPTVIVGETCMVNPNNEEKVGIVLEHLREVCNIPEQRKWLVVWSDGIPYLFGVRLQQYVYVCSSCEELVDTRKESLDDHHRSKHILFT